MQQASFVFWSEIGRRMGITGIPEELQEMIDWTEVSFRFFPLFSCVD